MKRTAVWIPAPEGGFVALNPETTTATQGESSEEALNNLREATELFLDRFPPSHSGRPMRAPCQEPTLLNPTIAPGLAGSGSDAVRQRGPQVLPQASLSSVEFVEMLYA